MPRLIVVSQDPVALVEELEATSEDTVAAVRRARKRLKLVFQVALKADCPVLVLSHGLACGPLAELAPVLATFCGIDGIHPAWLPTPVAAEVTAEPRQGSGMIALRAGGDRSDDRAARTIVIGGPPRSGTSLIAGVLHAAGLPLGQRLVPSTFENALQNILIKTSSAETWRRRLRGAWGAALANPRHFRLAWGGFDVPGLKALIAERRGDGPVWGFKRPGIGSFIRLGGFRLLERPRLIMGLRDPAAAATRITLAHGVDAREALRIASWFLLDSLETVQCCTAPTLLVSHERAKADPHGLFDRLLSFSGFECDAGRYDAIAAAVAEAGAIYRKDFAAPFFGEITSVIDGNLYGWVEGQEGRPVLVEILADDQRIATVSAKEEVGDAGRLLFVVGLPESEITGSTCIRAVLASSRHELRNSGQTVTQLQQG